MAIKKRKVDASLEKQILTGMIVSESFLQEIEPIYNSSLFSLKPGIIIAEWCLDYFKTYKKPPLSNIHDIYFRWCKTEPDEEDEKYIGEFLLGLDDDIERADKFNSAYMVDRALEYFRSQSLHNLQQELKGCLSQGDVEAAETAVIEFRKVEKSMSTGIDPFDNEAVIRTAFETRQSPLFTIPGKLGELMNEEFVRNSFIALIGPEKRGKSWWLMYIAMMAHRARCNVAFFQCGDMTEDQMVRRQMIYLAKKSDKLKYCGELKIPVLDCLNNQSDACTKRERIGTHGLDLSEDAPYDPTYIPCCYCNKKKGYSDFKGTLWYEIRPKVNPLTWQEAFKISKDYKKRIRPKGFKLDTYPNGYLNVARMKNQLDKWERTEGFVADVILSDYADIQAPESNISKEFRHQENEKWQAMRGLSQERHCCLITATQAAATSYEKDSVTRKDFSEDKRKYAHVTAMYALNQSKEEKRKGLMRLASLIVREDGFDEDYNVNVLQCLAIGRPYLASF